MAVDALELAAERRLENQIDDEIEGTLSTLLAHYDTVTANPRSMGYLRSLLKHYAKMPHPWRACYKDNFKRFGPKTAALCGVLKDTIRQSTHWRGHPAADVGSPGVGIAEADKGAAPAFGGHNNLKLDADLPIGVGDEVRRSSSNLELVGPEGIVRADHVAPEDGAILHDIEWADGTKSDCVRETEIRRISLYVPDDVMALFEDFVAQGCDPCRVMLGLDEAPHPTPTYLEAVSV